MLLLSMLARSILSYTIFLASRKIVQGTLSVSSEFKKHFKLHRCTDCYRLYSGEIKDCTFCGAFVKPLYQIYEEKISNQEKCKQDFEKREGLEKQLYSDTRKFNFEPLSAPTLKVENDRNTTSSDKKYSGSDQRRDRGFTGYKRDDRTLSA